MSFWIILSWVLVAVLTGVNLFLFFKLRAASKHMMRMAFPGAKNMNEAVGHMESMLRASKMRGRGSSAAASAQMKMAEDLLRQLQRP